ncbi:TetR/AcrR family transcriptional regulator [Microbacterium aureliae]
MTDQERTRPERVEVQRSRDLILAALEQHFAHHDDMPTMAQLARSAGVSSAALYRRFTSVADAIDTLYDDHLDAQQLVIDDMRAAATGWDGVVALVTGIGRLAVARPAILRVMRRKLELDPAIQHGEKWDASVRDVVQRAKDEGALRDDVDANDVSIAAWSLGEFGILPEVARARVVARQLGIVLDGLRARGGPTPLPGSAMDAGEIHRALRAGPA